MSATTSPQTFSDLYTDLQNRVRDATSVTATQNIAKRYINIALQDMHIGGGEKLPWAERDSILVTQPLYTTGTVTIAQGSTTLTGTSTLWTTTNVFGVANVRAGGKLVLAGSAEIYEVSAVGGAGSLTLRSRFVGSDITDSSYIYFEDEYALASDFLRPIDLQRFSQGATAVPLIDRREFRRIFPRNSTTGAPRVSYIGDEAPASNTTPIRHIHFSPAPDRALMIPYTYVTANLVTSSTGTAQTTFSADSDEPIVPMRYRMAIVLHALANWYRDRKDDVRSQEATAAYGDLMNRIYSDNETGTGRATIRRNVSRYRRNAKAPWTGGNAQGFDTNGSFDRMER